MNRDVVLVTGATRGIGASIVKTLGDAGWRTISNSRSIPTLTSHGLNSEHIAFDCADLDEVKNGLQKLKHQEVLLSDLVCCVGSGRIDIGPGENSWIKYLQINLLSCTQVIDSALEIFKTSLRNVVVISSLVGSKALVDPPIEYSVAKAALNQYIRVKAIKIAKSGKTINAVSPGNIMFPGSSWEDRFNSDKESTMNYVTSNVPLAKFGIPEDISLLIPFLLRRDSFATGQIFNIDGGQSL